MEFFSGLFLLAAYLWLMVWAPVKILRRAGYSRGVTLLVLFLGPVSLLVLAFNDWPIERELAWLKLENAGHVTGLFELAEDHALALEKRGDWKSAAEVYKTMIRRATDTQQADYYGKCLQRLGQLGGHSLLE
ncbi:MAG: hypothetical protein ACP5XB_12715 [Isosphaeraceae bacterium]